LHLVGDLIESYATFDVLREEDSSLLG